MSSNLVYFSSIRNEKVETIIIGDVSMIGYTQLVNISKTLSKGKLGDSQMAWYKAHLLNPFARAMDNLSRDRVALMNDYKALKKGLKVMDSTSVSLCMDNKMPMLIFDVRNRGSIRNALMGKKLGTVVGD